MNSATLAQYGLSFEAILATVVYAFLGITVMVIAIIFINNLFNLNMHRELVKEHNTAFGILFGSMAIAVAIIIAGTITS